MKLIEVNNKKITSEEFQLLKEELSKDSSIQLVEVAPNVYKTRLLG